MCNLRQPVAALIALGLYGCLGATSSFVPDGEAILDPRLLGTWTDSASHERAVITPAGSHSYAILYTDGQGRTVSFIGVLGRGPDNFILDVQPPADALGGYRDYAVRLHIPVVLDGIGPRIRVSVLEPDSLDRYLRDQPRALAHLRIGDQLALTADTPTLWQFVTTYIRRTGALTTPSTWIRRSS